MEVASISGQQLTGVTVAESGRLFTNFPRWREGIKMSVAEVKEGNAFAAYPNAAWNSYSPGDEITDDQFVCVQSVVAYQTELYVLDTRNPGFKGVLGSPALYVFNLENDSLVTFYQFPEGVYLPDSYFNDLRVDADRGKIYMTDSGHPGLILLDMETGISTRILNEHPSTTAEVDKLTIDGKDWNNRIHSDGIAFDPANGKLYYHALSGYTLYALDVAGMYSADGEVSPEDYVSSVAKTAAPDGMIMDLRGNLYYADLEHHQIMKRSPEGETSVVAEGEKVRWADTFSLHDGYLYYTNSRIHEAGGDISSLAFTINKVKI